MKKQKRKSLKHRLSINASTAPETTTHKSRKTTMRETEEQSPTSSTRTTESRTARQKFEARAVPKPANGHKSPYDCKNKFRKRLLKDGLPLVGQNTSAWGAILPFPSWMDPADRMPALRRWAERATRGEDEAAILVPCYRNERLIRGEGMVFSTTSAPKLRCDWALTTGAATSKTRINPIDPKKQRVPFSRTIFRGLATATHGSPNVVVTGSLAPVYQDAVAALAADIATCKPAVDGSSGTARLPLSNRSGTAPGEPTQGERKCRAKNCNNPMVDRPKQSRYCDEHSTPAARKRCRTHTAKANKEERVGSLPVDQSAGPPDTSPVKKISRKPSTDPRPVDAPKADSRELEPSASEANAQGNVGSVDHDSDGAEAQDGARDADGDDNSDSDSDSDVDDQDEAEDTNGDEDDGDPGHRPSRSSKRRPK
jgi:hypothetical protein